MVRSPTATTTATQCAAMARATLAAWKLADAASQRPKRPPRVRARRAYRAAVRRRESPWVGASGTCRRSIRLAARAPSRNVRAPAAPRAAARGAQGQARRLRGQRADISAGELPLSGAATRRWPPRWRGRRRGSDPPSGRACGRLRNQGPTPALWPHEAKARLARAARDKLHLAAAIAPLRPGESAWPPTGRASASASRQNRYSNWCPSAVPYCSAGRRQSSRPPRPGLEA